VASKFTLVTPSGTVQVWVVPVGQNVAWLVVPSFRGDGVPTLPRDGVRKWPRDAVLWLPGDTACEVLGDAAGDDAAGDDAAVDDAAGAVPATAVEQPASSSTPIDPAAAEVTHPARRECPCGLAAPVSPGRDFIHAFTTVPPRWSVRRFGVTRTIE
jgi:hypothetical protein